MQRQRRNSMRWDKWHYGAAGYYFITICTHNRECLFEATRLKEVAEIAWQRLPTFKSATKILMDAWVVMPNHIHGIIVIAEGYDQNAPRPSKTISGTVGALIGTYKAVVSNQINTMRSTKGRKVWQRGYYDRVIRNETELNAIREYIAQNPARWAEDRENLNKLLTRMTYHL